MFLLYSVGILSRSRFFPLLGTTIYIYIISLLSPLKFTIVIGTSYVPKVLRVFYSSTLSIGMYFNNYYNLALFTSIILIKSILV